MRASVALPTAKCPRCGEEMYVQDGRLVQHGSAAGDCAGSGMLAIDALIETDRPAIVAAMRARAARRQRRNQRRAG